MRAAREGPSRSGEDEGAQREKKAEKHDTRHAETHSAHVYVYRGTLSLFHVGAPAPAAGAAPLLAAVPFCSAVASLSPLRRLYFSCTKSVRSAFISVSLDTALKRELACKVQGIACKV